MIQQQQVGPPPQNQRPRVQQRDAEIAEFRKFKQNFVLTTVSKEQRRNVWKCQISKYNTLKF